MDKLLYIYDSKYIDTLKDELVDFDFVTLTSIVRECGQVSEIYRLDISQHVIDLTTFFFDTCNNRWHLGVLEEYIIEMHNQIEHVIFSLAKTEEQKFMDTYPFLFSKESIHYCQVEDEGNETKDQESKEIISINSNTNEILIYENISDIYNCNSEMNIFNFSQLVKDFNGLNANFNFEKIKEDIHYLIDLTTLVEYLRYRKDQVFIYELIFNNLMGNENIRYLIHDKSVNTMNEIFPFIFKEQKIFDEKVIDTCITSEPTDHKISLSEDIDLITSTLSKQLQGHNDFKHAFKSNLLKFKLLNRIGRRKIMSIFICGKSGIGKTEFARLLSQIMYPTEEQIKLNFGNYSSEGVLNSLIGSPLGYVGSEKGGELVNKINESGSKVILIDEFEKADEKVFNFFYELLEDGQFTDREGHVHDLDGYIIVFTSNLNTDNYHTHIPEPLHSRFDMKYFFTPLIVDEKLHFIQSYSSKLVQNLEDEFRISFDKDNLKNKLIDLVEYDNLRDIKRNIEDIIISEMDLNSI
ncbi:AAA family ATPase [Bacillus sp. T3]|uniref:AAA family ATPase n=1 Tax=Bacillus sp. T3 TaxID=467262 RepID=UPI0029811578|nr:AAA family ATPase [Bacillus sp. T3]